jgi:cytochrome oxidase Cu insertion factor (SCO1/SenC/PrrC family)
MRRATFVLSLVITGLAVLLAGCIGEPFRELPTAVLDTPTPSGTLAPDFSLPDLEGRKWSLSQFRGRPVVLFFWATW